MTIPQRTLLTGGRIHSRADPFATAMLIDGDIIGWIGDDAGAQVHEDVADRIVRLDGAFVAPGFVDSHIHATSTGLTLTGLDLSGLHSGEELLDAVHERAKATRGAPVYGHGWDDSSWAAQSTPTRAELDRAAWGSEVYLSRIDVHSALVSSALVAGAPQARGLDGYSADGPVAGSAHSMLRKWAFDRLTAGERARAHRAALDEALAHGIVAVHEMAGPSIGGFDDARGLLLLASEEPAPEVVVYWGELADERSVELARELGAYGLGGDLFVDGSLGSRTASLIDPYADSHGNGTAYLAAEEVSEHLRRTHEQGIPAGFHVIGDAACRVVAEAITALADEVGSARVRGLAPRLEHAEMMSAADIESLVALGTIFSMQPAFDEIWGGPGGMYEHRLGQERSRGMNRLADIVSAGGKLAINSDSPVTPMRPWSAIRAATEHNDPQQAISARAAFTAHTRGGWRAIGNTESGVIAPGAPAHLAVWQVSELEVRVPDERVQGWSTDPRAGTPGLPALIGDDPACLATVVAGQCLYGREFWESARAF